MHCLMNDAMCKKTSSNSLYLHDILSNGEIERILEYKRKKNDESTAEEDHNGRATGKSVQEGEFLVVEFNGSSSTW